MHASGEFWDGLSSWPGDYSSCPVEGPASGRRHSTMQATALPCRTCSLITQELQCAREELNAATLGICAWHRA